MYIERITKATITEIMTYCPCFQYMYQTLFENNTCICIHYYIFNMLNI